MTKDTKAERPDQKMSKHVPAPQLEASVRCQVSGTDAEVKAKREKTVNAWLAAVIFQVSERERRIPAASELEGEALETELLRGKQLDGPRFVSMRGGVYGDRDTRTAVELIQHNTSGLVLRVGWVFLQPGDAGYGDEGERQKRNARRGMGRARGCGGPTILIVIPSVRADEDHEL